MENTKGAVTKATTKGAAKGATKATKAKVSSSKTTTKVNKTGKKRVTFTLQTSVGKVISLAGSFNDWEPTEKYLVDKNNDGTYKVAIMLEPGIYEYKFVIDGVWHLDEANANFSSNDFGSLNSVIEVK